MNENEFLSPIDKLLSEDNTDTIVLYNENNEPVEFEQIAVIPLQGVVYVILRPVAEMDGIAEDEALVFAIEEVDDEECICVVDDNDIIDEVFAEYYKLLGEIPGDGES